ncbi:MAG: hypothetical protein AABX33_03980 [Nanoarchaeota archaeon]
MKRSKAQITLFIILVTILLFVVGIGIYFISNLQKEKIQNTQEKIQESNLELSPINRYVEECLKKASIESAFELGLQQGYNEVPSPYLDTNFSNIAYYSHKGNVLAPTTKIVEKELAKIIEENILIDCTDYSIFEKLGFNIEFNDINATTKIYNNEVIINVDYPLSIKKDNTISSVSKFTYALPIRLGHMLDVSNELVSAVSDEPYALDLTLLLNYDVDISVIHYDNCNDVYIIVDNESKTTYGDDYVFTFGVGLEEQYCKVNDSTEKLLLNISSYYKENNNPVLELIPYLSAITNQEFSYKLNAYDLDNDTLFFLTEGILQNYTYVLSGEIRFKPNESLKGMHLINATVIDINSGSDSQQFYLEIK